MERKEIITEIKRIISNKGFFIYGKTDLPLVLNATIDEKTKQYVSICYDTCVLMVITFDGEHQETNKVLYSDIHTNVLRQILFDMCVHYSLERPTFSDFKIDFSKLFNETKLNSDKKNILKRMLYHLSNGGLKNYLNDNYNRLKENYTTWFNTTYLDVILNEIDEITLLNRLLVVDQHLYFQECNLYNFGVLYHENLTKYFDNFDSDFRGNIVTIHRFDGEVIIETFLKRNRQTNFYNVRYNSTVFEDLTSAYIRGKSPNFGEAIMKLIQSEN